MRADLPVARDDLLQDALRVRLSLAGAGRERFAETNGVGEVAREHSMLDFSRRVLVVVVEPDLVPADAARVRHRVEAGRA
jgi:hypothetical protein